jgi:hypothetical protein
MEIPLLPSTESIDPEDNKDKDIKEKMKGSKQSGQIGYTIQTSSSGITIQVSHKNMPAAISSEHNQYEISYYQIIEYTKDNPDSFIKAFDFDNDRVIQTVELNDWNDIQQTMLLDDNMNSNNKTASSSYYTASTKNGVAKFNFFVNYQGPTQDSNNELPSPPSSLPNDIAANILSIDFWLVDFPWRSGSNSYLAVLSNVRSSGTSSSSSQQQEVNYLLLDRIHTMETAMGQHQDVSSDGSNNTSESKKSPKTKNKTGINILFPSLSDGLDDSTALSSSSVAVGTYQWPNIASTFFHESDEASPSTDTTTVAALLGEESSNNNNNNVNAGGTSFDSTDSNNDQINTVTVIATSSSNRYDDELTIAYSFIGPNNDTVRTVYWEPQIGMVFKSLSDTIFEESINRTDGANNNNNNPDDDFFGVYDSAAYSRRAPFYNMKGCLPVIITIGFFMTF